MATAIKVWEVLGNNLVEIKDDDFASEHFEKDLESWIACNPALLGRKLLAIKRQHEIPEVGILDLLCVDEDGKLVIVEFKRDLTRREAVAQALDYASWLDGTSEAEIRNIAAEALKKPIEDAFLERFGSELQSLTPQNHRILLVAPKLDSSAERIVDYLADRYGVEINAVFFRYAKTSNNREILVRTVLVPDRPGSPSDPELTVPQLLAMAKERGVLPLTEACRSAGAFLSEEPQKTYKGSFRYWLLGRMVFGVNVSGGRDGAPVGELHVWIPPKSLADVSGLLESDLRASLKNKYHAYEVGKYDMIISLKSSDEVKGLVAELRRWAEIAKERIQTPMIV